MGQIGDEVLMEDVTVDLAAGFEVVGDDCVEEAGGAVAGWVFYLTAVACDGMLVAS